MTAPAPTVCPTCKGDEVLLYDGMFGLDRDEVPCRDCCCEVCGQPTGTPPLCEKHQREQDDRDAAKAYREGRYE